MINPSESLEIEIGKIRAEVRRRGGFTVGCEQLRILCPDYLTSPQQFAAIAAIAKRERWSFAFMRDGSVHFGAYSTALPTRAADATSTAAYQERQTKL